MAANGAAARILTILGAAGLIAACDQLSQGSQAELDWAKAAIERNDALEIVATDQQSGAFTVRVKESGELRVVKANELVAALPPAADSGSTTSAAADVPSSPATSAEAADPAATQPEEPASPDAKDSSVAQSTPAVSGGELAKQETRQTQAEQKDVIRSGPGYTVSRASEPAATARPAVTDTRVSTAAVEHRYEPIICQGARLLHIDNRNLEFEGDAVTAEDGCEIHITNSRISARGTGVSARAASVHIKNSSIEGESGSVEASEGAQVYAQSSTFRGLQRRLDSSVFHDLGGNVWNN